MAGTYRLLSAIRDRGGKAGRFVYISSDAVYWRGGSVPAEYLPVDEEHPRRPGSVYGASKVAAEELSLAFWRAHGLPITVVRPSATTDAAELVDANSVFGARMFVAPAIRAMESSRSGVPDADLLAALRAHDDGRPRLFVTADMDGRTARMSLNDARDAAAGIVSALDSPDAVGRAFNVGPAGSHDEGELLAHIGERLHVPVVVIRTPGHGRAGSYRVNGQGVSWGTGPRGPYSIWWTRPWRAKEADHEHRGGTCKLVGNRRVSGGGGWHGWPGERG